MLHLLSGSNHKRFPIRCLGYHGTLPENRHLHLLLAFLRLDDPSSSSSCCNLRNWRSETTNDLSRSIFVPQIWTVFTAYNQWPRQKKIYQILFGEVLFIRMGRKKEYRFSLKKDKVAGLILL